MERFSSTAARAGLSRIVPMSVISSRIGVVRLISIGVGAQGIRISSAYLSADRAIPAWSSSCGASMITTSSAWASSGTRRCNSREGSATIRNGKAASSGASRGYMAARSDHSRALPDGSASTSSTLFPACAKTWASQTADVVLPVPGLRLASATLSPVTWALSQRLPGFGSGADTLAPCAQSGTIGEHKKTSPLGTDVLPGNHPPARSWQQRAQRARSQYPCSSAVIQELLHYCNRPGEPCSPAPDHLWPPSITVASCAQPGQCCGSPAADRGGNLLPLTTC